VLAGQEIDAMAVLYRLTAPVLLVALRFVDPSAVTGRPRPRD